MIINPIGIFTVSLFLNRNKEKDRKPTKKKKTKTKEMPCLLLKRELVNTDSRNPMMQTAQ